MSSLNQVVLLGNLGKDPETRYTQSGDAVCNFSMATTERWKDKNGDKQEKTEWHNIVCFKRAAEIAGEYLKKGSSCLIVGHIQTRKWQDKEGKDRYTTEIVCDKLTLLGSPRGGEKQESRPAKQKATTGHGDGDDDPTDDIPF